MHVVWVVPNAHPNHRGWIAGLNQRGHRNSIETVRLTGTKVGGWTDSLDVEIRLIAESRVSTFLRHRFPGRRDKGRRLFFPPIRDYLRSLDRLGADVVIVRPHSIPLLCLVSFHCRRRRIPLLVYELHDPRRSREWRNRRLPRRDRVQAIYGSLRLRFLGSVFGNGVMSPVLLSDIDDAERHASFIPFPATPFADTREEIGPGVELVRPSDSGLKVLAVARFMPRKHHVPLIEAIEALRDGGSDVTCVIVGQAAGKKEEALLRAIRDRVDSSPHRRAIAVLANLSADASLAQLYKDADVFTLPSEREPAGMAVVEAIGHALPVIVSASCGTAGYVQHEQTGFHIEAGSKDALERALGRLDRDQHELRRMASATAARRDADLSREIVAQRLESRLLSALGREH